MTHRSSKESVITAIQPMYPDFDLSINAHCQVCPQREPSAIVRRERSTSCFRVITTKTDN